MGELRVLRMEARHINDVLNIEQICFSIPWTKADFIKEVNVNTLARYFVAEMDGKIIGYAGMWHIVTEGHITNLAVLPEYRRHGAGRALLKAIIDYAKQKELIGITLEVSISNLSAQKLYTSNGFKPEGFRKKYYADTGEDAVIMWLHLKQGD